MNLSGGLESLKTRIGQIIGQEVDAFDHQFAVTKSELEQFYSQSSGAYSSLGSFSEQGNVLSRDNEPEGFAFGYEEIKSVKSQDKMYFPLVYPFLKYAATAIEENSECGFLLFNYALRSVISFPLGDCNVYMVDSNVSGDFNTLSQISTRLEEAEADKPYFHYITEHDERERLISDLTGIMDSNIRNYVSKYSDLRSYNRDNQVMHVPYHFVFIKDIASAYPDKSQIDRLAHLISSDNARKAGIYIFYTYDKDAINNDPDSYHADTYRAVRNLLSLSHIVNNWERHFADANLIAEPKATMDVSDKVVTFVETHKPPKTVMTFKDVIENKLSQGTLWNPPFKRERNHLPFIVGFQNAITPKVIDVRFGGLSPHIFIGGKSGSGKSILLHNFILNGAVRYSPEELQFYLVDMKGGVSFAPYKQLPHVVALSASSSRHYAMSLLELFGEENKRRLSLFKREGAPNLDLYNEKVVKSGRKPLPYLFGIIDEFQVLFDFNDEIARNAERLITSIHRLSRAAGIFLALCTQKAPGNVDRSQVGIKMSLICNPNDSLTLIGNPAASRLRGIGRAIVNINDTGEERYNQEFQVAFIDETKELPLFVERIRQIHLSRHDNHDPLDHLVFDDNERKVPLSPSLLSNAEGQTEQTKRFIYLGVPGFFRKEHVKFYFHRDSQSNIALVGNDRPAALRLTGIIIIQFMMVYKNMGAKVYISDLQKQLEPTYGKLAFLNGRDGISHSGQEDIKNTMDEVYQLLNERKANPRKSVSEPEVLYALLDLKPDTNFTASSGGGISFGVEVEKSPIDMLKELIEEGPDYGIHLLVYSYNFSNMEALLNNFGNSLLPKMEIKIALRGGNSTKLLRYFGNGELIENYGEGVVLMPEEMGLKNKGDDDFGDPFMIYDTINDKRLRGTVWETLFNNLPNKED